MPRARPPAGALSASGPELDFPQETGDYLAFLNEVGGRLVGAIDLEVTASRIVELAVPTLADCAMLLLPDIRGRLEWWRWAGRGRTLRGRVRRPAAETAPRLTSVLVDEPRDADLLLALGNVADLADHADRRLRRQPESLPQLEVEPLLRAAFAMQSFGMHPSR